MDRFRVNPFFSLHKRAATLVDSITSTVRTLLHYRLGLFTLGSRALSKQFSEGVQEESVTRWLLLKSAEAGQHQSFCERIIGI